VKLPEPSPPPWTSASMLPGLRRPWTALLAVVLVIVSALVALRPTPAVAAASFTNPLNSSGADPWMTHYNGSYYLMTTPYAGALTMRRAPTIAALKTANAQPVFSAHAPGRDNLIWAPEFHLLDRTERTAMVHLLLRRPG
jgi:hypothetical protein